MVKSGRNTPNVMRYLEMGCIPIGFITMKIRIMFSHCNLKEEQKSLVYTFFPAQFDYPVCGDWSLTVRANMK